MKLKSKLSKLVSVFTVAVMCFTMLPKTSTFTSSAANVGDKLSVGSGTNQHKGNCDGYSYEVWLDNTGGSGSMTLGKGASFKAEWSASVSQGNFLARRGLDFGSTKKATDYDYIGLDYDATYSQTGNGGNSRLCVYGWFENRNAAGNPPLVEYYIIEDWVNWRPTANGASKTVTIDGGQYEIFAIDHTGPTIHGNSETFKQYFSVRKNTRTSGHITVSDHFKAWADQGWGIGNLYEVALNAEGWESSGVADVKMLDVYTDPDKRDPNVGPVTPTPTIEPDKDGNYFYDTFESGAGNWASRGDASVATDSKNYYAGSNSLAVTGRTDNWHGAAISLDSGAFVPGNTYSFSTGVLQKSGSATEMKLTLQYTLNGEENYDEVASATAKSGEWTKLENTSFTIPSGATNMILYVEAPDSLTDFYIDEAKGSKEGVKSSVVNGGGVVSGTTTPVTTTTTANPNTDLKVKLWGDANNNGKLEIADAVLIMQAVANADKYGVGGTDDYCLTPQGKLNADCYQPGSDLTSMDALAVQKAIAGLVKLPEGDSINVNVTTTAAPVVTTVAPQKINPTEYMASVRATMTNNVPSSATSGNSDYGTLEKISYFSSNAARNKSANVLLPAGYDKSKKYPVLYVQHGIFGDENSMLSGMNIREMAGNLVKSGEAEEMIIVFTSMYTSKTQAAPNGFTIDLPTTQAYDAFLYDLTEDLMPYIESHYSVKTGRENTAISGFSMGGRESLYIGVSRPDLFGYIGAACPAPGVTPGVDMYMDHPGCMTEAEFKINDAANKPYVFMITGGTNDGVVGTFPQKYHQILTTNGEDHIWQEIQGGGHDASCVTPHFYNFLRNIFKTGAGSSTSNTGNNNNTSNANFFNNTFSSSTDGWEERGSVSLSLDSNSYYSAGNSLKVAGRSETWHGAQMPLDSSFKAGSTYSFSAAVMQASGSDIDAKMTLQYSLDGEDKYASIDLQTAKNKEWTKLENTAFTIPSGAVNPVLYIELPDSTADFYIDDIQVAEKGTASKVVTGKGTIGNIPDAPVVTPGTIDPSKPMVAISFDDGAVGSSANATSMRIINALAKQDFRATFFYVGDWIRNADGEQEVKYAYSKGMEIANHSTSHPDLSTKSASEIRSEYDKCAAKLKGIIGAEPSKLLRLPYLGCNDTVKSTLNDVPLITCSIDTGDWNNASKDQIVNKIKQAMNDGSLNGAIVLCHETYETTAAAIEELAPYLKSQGWQIVTISEMFAAKGKTLNGGQVYTNCK